MMINTVNLVKLWDTQLYSVTLSNVLGHLVTFWDTQLCSGTPSYVLGYLVMFWDTQLHSGTHIVKIWDINVSFFLVCSYKFSVCVFQSSSNFATIKCSQSQLLKSIYMYSLISMHVSLSHINARFLKSYQCTFP